MNTDFSSLALRSELLQAIEQMKFEQVTPIQAVALPPMLTGEDVIAQAHTGSGKTAAFGLALLQRLEVERPDAQALVLCPTRELADQVSEELRRLSQRLPTVRVITLCGGRSGRAQRQALDGAHQVVVGTPGRVADHLARGHLDPRALTVVVLDEADRLLDMGFSDEVEGILRRCPSSRQTLLFSATFPDAVRGLSARVQRSPVSVQVEGQEQVELLAQQVVFCERRERHEVVARLLAHHRPPAALLFCETRAACEALVSYLRQRGADALALHGQLEQRDRDDVLLQFSQGSVRVLVATNVAARGLDIPSLPMVVITELSPDPESHVHRIGRTARAGQEGLAINIVASEGERARLERVEAYLGRKLEELDLPDGGTDLRDLVAEYRTLLLLVGRLDKLRRGDVLGALVKDAGLPPAAMGRIDLMDRSCGVAIRREHAERALAYVRGGGRIKKRKVRAQLLGD